MSGRIELAGRAARLRPIEPADAEQAFAILHDNRAILDWLEWPGPDDVEQMRARFGCWRARGVDADDFAFAIEDRASTAFAGALTLRFAGHSGLGVLGYWVDPARWGRGLATDAVRLAIWLAFERLGADAVCARVHVGNDPSRRVLEKAGFGEVEADELPGQPGCGARPQWGFRLERSAFEALSRELAPVHAVVELRADQP